MKQVLGALFLEILKWVFSCWLLLLVAVVGLYDFIVVGALICYTFYGPSEFPFRSFANIRITGSRMDLFPAPPPSSSSSFLTTTTDRQETLFWSGRAMYKVGTKLLARCSTFALQNSSREKRIHLISQHSTTLDRSSSSKSTVSSTRRAAAEMNVAHF